MMKSDWAVRFLYRTKIGRLLLQFIQKSGADRLIVRFLCSACSRPLIGWYIKKHGVRMEEYETERFRSFRDFFARRKKPVALDLEPTHFISPCDGWLSAHPISMGSGFSIKGSYYRLGDMLRDEKLCKQYEGGDCLIFRLSAADYHHFCYIDDCYQGKHHEIPGELHSVQPIACETVPVYTLNRRSWSLLATDNLGPVVQVEIGALIVGGIFHEREDARVCRGMEMGHFELAGSTIMLLFQKGRVSLMPHIRETLSRGEEFRVRQGQRIGTAAGKGSICHALQEISSTEHDIP